MTELEWLSVDARPNSPNALGENCRYESDCDQVLPCVRRGNAVDSLGVCIEAAMDGDCPSPYNVYGMISLSEPTAWVADNRLCLTSSMLCSSFPEDTCTGDGGVTGYFDWSSSNPYDPNGTWKCCVSNPAYSCEGFCADPPECLLIGVICNDEPPEICQ